MPLWFSDIDEYEDYDNSCFLLGTSDDLEYVEKQSKKYDNNCSLLGVED